MSGHEIHEFTVREDYKLNNLAPNKFFSLFAEIYFDLRKIKFINDESVYIRFKEVTSEEFLKYIINYIKQSPHKSNDIYSAFIETFKSIEKNLQAKVLNSPPFQSDDDEISKIKELKLELFRFCTRRFVNDVSNFDDLDDLLFGI